MDRNCDIICLTISRWDDPISSPSLSLAKEFALNNRVFYIDHPYSFKDLVSLWKTEQLSKRKPALLKQGSPYQQPASLPENLHVITPPLTLPVNSLPPGNFYDFFSKQNDKKLEKTIQKTINKFNIKQYIYINFFDPYFLSVFPKDLHPLRTVYQSMDDITQVAYSNRHGSRLEGVMAKNYDHTLCTSRELTRLMSKYTPNAHLLPNAADTAVFNKAVNEDLPKPEDLPNDGLPIVGFTGNLEYRSDFELLKKIAETHSEKNLVIVGPVKTDEHIKIGLDKLKNVYFTGPKKITELPAYLKYFSVAIIPFRLTTLTKSIYPLKINEYLAAGKPVVATNFSNDIASFGDVAYVSASHEEFLKNIDKAIKENNEEKISRRLAKASSNTWKARVSQFWDIIEKEPVSV